VTSAFTPRETVSELDRYIIGQDKAKRAVAVAMRNRWRRQQVEGELRDEITPKNIIMIGPTGVGKTEIARRLAKLVNAPFIKVEASKFTEVGYVGKDVESMIRELTDIGVKIVREEETKKINVRAADAAEDAVLDLFDASRAAVLAAKGGLETDATPEAVRTKLRQMLRWHKLDDEEVELAAPAPGPVMPMIEVMTPGGMEEMGQNIKEMMSQFMPQERKARKVKVAEALDMLTQEEASKMIDMDAVKKLAVERTEQHGIVFLDEIDKIAKADQQRGPDVSREGVQRDILPIVEGSSVMTKHGMVRTDHILFIAAGAFHASKPSDLIPELQGRFPIRVNLDALTRDDFYRILTEPKNSLTRQYTALMETEGVSLRLEKDGIDTICDIAVQLNDQTENIGARRLHTVMERVLEEIAFIAPEKPKEEFVVDKDYVDGRLQDIVKDRDLSRYIL
jgi:ATP-dependent HslUV protease ATP-binding subunit HslU